MPGPQPLTLRIHKFSTQRTVHGKEGCFPPLCLLPYIPIPPFLLLIISSFVPFLSSFLLPFISFLSLQQMATHPRPGILQGDWSTSLKKMGVALL